MSSWRDGIVVAALAALNVSGKPCNFERTRTAKLTDADLPHGSLYWGQDVVVDSLRDHVPVVRSNLSLMLELRALGTSSLRPDQAVDPLYVWAVSKLSNNKLGGAVISMVEGNSTQQFEQGDRPLVLLTLEMIAQYQHLTANAEANK